MKKEFVVLTETPIDTQKKIRQWVSTGYEIEIVAQHTEKDRNTGIILKLITSLWRNNVNI